MTKTRKDQKYAPHSPSPQSKTTPRLCAAACARTARQLQQQGQIPPEVPEAEINAEMEKHVPGIVAAVYRSPLYPHLKEKHPRKLQQYIMDVLSRTSPGLVPAVAADQISYRNTLTGEAATPTWTHHNCGGTVYPTVGSTFACSVCKKVGQLGVSVPDGISRAKQMQYLLTDVEEVELI